MRNIFSKILISFFMLGIFLVPVSASLQIKKETITLNIEKNIAFAEPDQFWLAWVVPVVGLQIKPFGDDETACKNKMEEEKKVGNSIKTPCIKGQKPIFNILGQQKEPTFEDTIDCGITAPFRCIVLVFYKIFSALAMVTRGAATILDFFIEYALKSTSYKNTFIEAAWGTVRDVANIFFLLGLLYVAIQIVLDIHVSEKKKMIGNIIVMALLVNFSLFATQVVIDTSNIMARVFYNQVTSKNDNQNYNKGKPKPITESLVSTFDPQNLITSKDVSSGQMFAVILVAILIIIYMIYMFLSVAFLFLGRVVTLWISMIFAPIAFMSRALGIKALEDLSWDRWLHNLINAAIMAPIFLFFLYIIILLGDSLQTAISYKPTDGNWLSSMLSVVIPFAIIFTLLMKAKSLAVKYSGDMGAALSKVGPALGGLALGGAALGAAAIGRGTVGAVAKYSKKENDTSRNKDKNIRQNIKDKWNNSAWYQKAGLVASSVYGGGLAKIAGKGLAAKVAESFTTKTRDANTGAVTQRTGFGNMVADYKTKTHDSQIIQSKISEKADELHIDKNTKWADLTDDHKTEIKKSVNQDIISKEIYGRKFSSLTNTDEIKAIKNANITDLGGGKMDYRVTDSKGSYSRQNQDNAEHIVSAANKNSGFSDIVGEATYSGAKGSWDIRNISKASSKELKSVVALLAGIAILLRGGLKKGNMDPGVGQKDFFKDLTEVITGAMKTAGAGMAASVAKDAAHKAGGHDDHGGGGHH